MHDSKIRLRLLTGGLIPSWAKEKKGTGHISGYTYYENIHAFKGIGIANEDVKKDLSGDIVSDFLLYKEQLFW